MTTSLLNVFIFTSTKRSYFLHHFTLDRALGLTGCYSPKNDTYSKIESICPSKDCEVLKEIYKNSNLESLSKEQRGILKKADRDEIKKKIDYFQSYVGADILDTNNLSDKDIIFAGKWMEKFYYNRDH